MQPAVWAVPVSNAEPRVGERSQKLLLAAERGYALGVTALEKDLLEALLALESAAAKARSAPVAGGILPLIQRVDDLGAKLPAEAHPDLRHYLQRKSYEKARQLLQGMGDQITPGRCG